MPTPKKIEWLLSYSLALNQGCFVALFLTRMLSLSLGLSLNKPPRLILASLTCVTIALTPQVA